MKSNNSSETVVSIERALIILKRLAAAKGEVGVRGLSRDLGYSAAVTQKTLNTLKLHDFVQQNSATGRYSLGFGTVRIGLAMLDRLDVVRIAHPQMKDLTNVTGETTFLAIRDGLNAVYINKVRSPNAIRMDAEIGSNRPLNCTAVGKALLAWASPELISEMIQADAFVKSTENSIMEPDVLETQLVKVRELGYVLDQREFHKDGICVAAPIFDPNGDVIASITISGLASRMEGRLEEHAALVMEKASAISETLGFKGDLF